ncbi:MAG: hypothetical protein FJ246_07425, partial [Nitrospira sp.]|nr:hypothetical protein [Nitrospira sp.]
TFGAAIAALTISISLPRVYVANATLLPTQAADTGSAFAASLVSQLGPAAGMFGAIGSGRTGDLVEILGSRTMAQRVIARAGLKGHFKKAKTQSEIVSRLKAMTRISGPSVGSKLIEVKVESQNADLAAEVANAYVSELKLMLDEIGYNAAARNRRFIEGQLEKNRADLLKVEQQLTTFQATNRLASLPETVVASIRAISDLEAQKIGTEVQLQGISETLSAVKSNVFSLQADPKSVVDLEVRKRSLSAQQQALDRARQAFLNKLSGLPPKAMELARLQRDVQVQNAIYLALNQQYQSALINESKDSDSFLPLDRAERPDRPSFPRRGLIIAIGTMIGILLGAALILAMEWFRTETSK